MSWKFTSARCLAATQTGFLLLWALLFPSLSLFAAQELPPSATLKKSVNLIQVPVVVRDSRGHTVTNLKSNDFAVYDNGQLQPITQFRYLAEGSGSRDLGNPAQTEVGPPNGSEIQHSASPAALPELLETHLLIVIPQLQWTSRSYALRALAKALQHHLFDNESVSIVDNSSLILPFTRDAGSLQQAITELQKLNMSPCHAGPWIAAAEERLLQMRSMPGRKFLLIFSDGVPDPQCVSGISYVGNSPWRLMASALDSNVAIYPVDPRGVVPVIPGGDASTDLSSGGGLRELTSAINENLSQELTLLGMQRSNLLQVAAQTGGRAPAGNDLEHAFRDMREDSSYYELAYYLPDLQADGAYHHLRVTLRRSDLQVLAKAGYFAPIPFAGMSRGAKRDWLYRAVLANQPLGEIELSSRSSAFLNPPSPDITIHFAVHASWWVPQEHAGDRRWTMLVGVVQDEHGTVIDHLDTTNFWHADDQPEEESGYIRQDATYNVLLRLKPGRYALKLAIADLYAAIAGSHVTFFQVPEQALHLPQASSLVLSDKWLQVQSTGESGETAENPAGMVNSIGIDRSPDPLRVADRRLRPSVNRIFAGDAQLSIFVRFYPEQNDHFPQGWRISAILRDSAGKVLANNSVADSSISTPGVPGIPVFYSFDLSQFPMRDGRYSAELEFARPDRKQPLQVRASFIVHTVENPH